ncbi:MAG: response regulator, partial [Methanomassiliicoccales archaeon]
MEASAIKIILVDDEEAILDISKGYLGLDGGILADTVTSVAAARELLNLREYDVVVSDYQMPREDGLAFLRSLRACGNNIPFILFTGKGRETVAIEALNSGASFYLQKGG